MDIYISDQLMSCLAFTILGILSGLAYDTVRTLRYLMISDTEHTKVKTVVCSIVDFLFDILFMLCLSVSVVILTYCYSYGKLRFFDTLSFALSFYIYRFTLGKLYSVSVRPLALKSKQLVIRIIVLCTKPVKFLLFILRSFILWVFTLTIGKLLEKIRSARQEARFKEILEQLECDVVF